VGIYEGMYGNMWQHVATRGNTVNTPKNMDIDCLYHPPSTEKEWWDMNTHDEFYWPIALVFTVWVLIKIVWPSLYDWYKNRK
jgi:hypothetical protein